MLTAFPVHVGKLGEFYMNSYLSSMYSIYYTYICYRYYIMGLPRWFIDKESACQFRRPRSVGLIPGSEDPLEEKMATQTNILGWKILWTEEPGGLQSIGSQRVRHD